MSFKGRVSRIFASDFFHESSSPKPLKITLGSFQIFLKFAEIFASQGAPPVSMTQVVTLPPVSTKPAANFATSSAVVVDTGGKLATGVNDSDGTCHRHQRHWRQICHWQRHWQQICHCQWHPWQTMGIISDCWQLKVNLKENIYLYANSTAPKVSK